MSEEVTLARPLLFLRLLGLSSLRRGILQVTRVLGFGCHARLEVSGRVCDRNSVETVVIDDDDVGCMDNGCSGTLDKGLN